MTHTTVEPDEATRLRNNVVDTLRAEGWITSPEVEAVMRRRFPATRSPPRCRLEKAYEPYAAVVTKTDEHGVQLSSVSAPQIQALMLEQAQVRPGMRVLEIGSGGLNAAYLAELVGKDGEVTTVDIDPVVTDRASRLLAEHGYGRVDRRHGGRRRAHRRPRAGRRRDGDRRSLGHPAGLGGPAPA